MSLQSDIIFRNLNEYRRRKQRDRKVLSDVSLALALLLMIFFLLWVGMGRPSMGVGFDEWPSAVLLVALVVVIWLMRRWWLTLLSRRRLQQRLEEDENLLIDIDNWFKEKK